MKKAERELVKVTINLFAGDVEKLREYYPDVGASAVIRRLIERFLEQIEAHGVASLNAEVEIKI